MTCSSFGGALLYLGVLPCALACAVVGGNQIVPGTGADPEGDAGVSTVKPDAGDAGGDSTQTSGLTRRLRRLSNREYDNVVRDLLGDVSEPARRFIPDVYPNGYDNGSGALAVQSDQAATYQDAAEVLAANAVSGEMKRLIGDCDPEAAGADACQEIFLSSFAPRAFRRPLTETERARLSEMFQAGMSAGGFEIGIRTELELILQSPEFLYREELGSPSAAADPGTSVLLTDYEVASELSFLVTGSIPDDELWSAAQEQRLSSAEELRAQASRLLALPGAKPALRAFLQQWFATDKLDDLVKDYRFYPTFSVDMAASMAGELDRFYESVLGTGSLRALFTSNQSFVDPTLGAVYEVGVAEPGFHPVLLDAQTRPGILSRAGFLAAHAAVDSSGPISRGVFVLQRILCAPPAPPPANVPAALLATDAPAQTLTTRQRFEEHLSNPFCAACHRSIDGIGFGFEHFDGIGTYRTLDHDLPVDSTGSIVGTGEIDGDYDGLSELALRLAGSQTLVDCYVRQAYRYAMGEVEPTRADLASLDWLKAGFSPDSQLTDVLLTLVANPAFVTRRFE